MKSRATTARCPPERLFRDFTVEVPVKETFTDKPDTDLEEDTKGTKFI